MLGPEPDFLKDQLVILTTEPSLQTRNEDTFI